MDLPRRLHRMIASERICAKRGTYLPTSLHDSSRQHMDRISEHSPTVGDLTLLNGKSPLLSLLEVVRTPRRATHLHVSFPVRQAFPEAPHSQVQANWQRVPLYHPRFPFHLAPGTSSWRLRHSTTWHIPPQLQHPDLCLPLLHRRGIWTTRATCLATYPDLQSF
jgi:hypothetical protein